MSSVEKQVLLKLANSKHLPELLHHWVINTGKTKTSIFDNASNDDELWTEEELETACSKIQNFYRRSVLEDDLSLPADFPENLNTALITVCKLRQKDILNSIFREQLVNSGHNLVENIDWKLRWVMGSSKLATFREPVCQVDLFCASADLNAGTFRKIINFEANLDDIDNLINQLNDVKSELDGIS